MIIDGSSLFSFTWYPPQIFSPGLANTPTPLETIANKQKVLNSPEAFFHAFGQSPDEPLSCQLQSSRFFNVTE